MTIMKEKVNEINKTYSEEFEKTGTRNYLNLNLGNGYAPSDTVYCNGCIVCRIDDIGKMIKELEMLQSCIEYETGVFI